LATIEEIFGTNEVYADLDIAYYEGNAGHIGVGVNSSATVG